MYDAVLLVSFGGPEGPDDVLPFLENVLLGRNVPRARMLEVAEHYHHFGGVSPINAQNRALIAALRQELAAYGPNLPIYWGNRNWHPLLPDTLAQMRADGIQRAIAFFTSAYSSYSGCRQYRENILAAANAIGPGAPQVDKLRVFYNHPGFIEPMLEQTQTALAQLSSEQQASAAVLFTAHSIPVAMAQNTRYQAQLQETCRLIAEELRKCTDSHHGKQWRGPWQLVYQSRSGPPTQPWLEPDIGDALRQVHAEGIPAAVVVPVGFISDHMEVLYDLDTEAREICQHLGLPMVRAATVGTHPRFVRMIRELITERIATERHKVDPTAPAPERMALGQFPANHDVCPVDCCLSGRP